MKSTFSFKDRRFLLFFACFMLVLLRYNASASTLQTRSLCNRSFNVDAQGADVKARLNRGETVLLKNPKTDSDFHMFYGIRKLNADAAVAMGVAASFEEMSRNVSTVAESTVLSRKSNYAKVRFEVVVDSAFIPNSHFVSNIYVVKNGTGYLQFWNLDSSSGLSRPIFADGFIRMDAGANGGSTLVYCAYNVPSMQIAPGMANSMQSDGVRNTINDMSKWIEKSAASSTLHKKYTDFLSSILK